ncbi:hypothetical protein K3495_g15549, partial [Podosphaera aphanis]
MSLEDIVSGLKDFQLAVTPPAPQLAVTSPAPQLAETSQAPQTQKTMTGNKSESTKPTIKWPKWSGDPVDFPAFQISLEGVAEEGIDHKSFCYSVFSQSLPAEAQRRVAPWMKTQKIANDWS